MSIKGLGVEMSWSSADRDLLLVLG